MTIDVVYLGPKAERVLELPCPLVSRSEKTGEIRFLKDRGTAIEEDLATYLTKTFPETFQRVEAVRQAKANKEMDERTRKRLAFARQMAGREFTGLNAKLSADLYVKRKHIAEFVILEETSKGFRLVLRPDRIAAKEPELIAQAVPDDQASAGHKESYADSDGTDRTGDDDADDLDADGNSGTHDGLGDELPTDTQDGPRTASVRAEG